MKPLNFTNSTYQHNSETKQSNTSLRALMVDLALAGCGAEAIAASTYTMTNLSAITSGGMAGIDAVAINNKGQILGTANLFGIQKTVIFDSLTGSVTDAGVNFTSGAGINNVGQVVGTSGFVGNMTATGILRNVDGSVIDLGALPGYNYGSTWATAVNDSGQVAGTSFSSTGWGSGQAYIWSANGGMQGLGSLVGPGTWSRAYGINASGQVVGESYYGSACFITMGHAFVTTSTGMKDLHFPGMDTQLSLASCSSSFASKINDSGMAVGGYTYSLGLSGRTGPARIMHTTFWNTLTGTYTDLSNATNPKTSQTLSDINASGQVVGSEVTFSGTMVSNWYEGTVSGSQHALIGDININGGGLKDLNVAYTNKPAGWIFQAALDINDAGQILAQATDPSGAVQKVLLTPSTTLVAPSNLTAVATSSTQINLTWADNANNETAQYVERCAGAGCTNFVQVASLAANVTSYSDTGLTAGTSYSYRVRAHGAAGDSAYSNTATASTSATVNTAPAAPSNLISNAKTRNQVVLAWADNASNELNYLIERCKGASCTNFIQVAKVGANVTAYSNTGLSRNTSYNYRVRAANATGNSVYSNTLSVKTLP